MKFSDAKIIEFLSNSPLKSFSAMLDTLRYLDGQNIWDDIEYELFDFALGDNPENKVQIRVPDVKGMLAANFLFKFTRYALQFRLVRRRKVPHSNQRPADEPQELRVFYTLTPFGKTMVRILDAVEVAKRTRKGS